VKHWAWHALPKRTAQELTPTISIRPFPSNHFHPPSDHFLPTISIHAGSGKFSGQTLTLGARGDSYYEYLLKQFLQVRVPIILLVASPT
jgi:hypothetical protein